MNKFFSALLTLTVFFSLSTMASNYPSDMTMFQEQPVTQGPLTVTRGLQYSGKAVLEIDYNGYLKNIDSPIYLTATVHYQNGDVTKVFQMQNWGSVYHVRLTAGCLVGAMGGCAAIGTDDMKDLLVYAQYANRLNGLDIDFAVSNSFNQWDSSLGGNYSFHFLQNSH
jgi:hypothetical protein